MVEQYKSVMWHTHWQVCKDINYFTLQSGDIANQPIFLLDEDPKLCALSLAMKHVKEYIEYITYSIIKFRGTPFVKKETDVENKPRVDYMFYNQRTAYWFYTFYNELQRIHKEKTGRYYKVTEHFKETWINDMQRVTGPMDVKRKAYKGVRLPNEKCVREKYQDIYQHYKWTIDKINSKIGRFRVMYMLLGFLNSEFPCGAPAWYNTLKATIWKSFNKMTRLYYRIDTSVEGKYSYYYSVDDKNWIEIKNIPFEMRGLIDGIIFSREV